MNISRRLDRMTALCGMVALLAFALADQNATLVLVAAPMLLVAWTVGGQGRPPVIGTLGMNLLVLSAAAYTVYNALVLRTALISSVSSFLALIFVVKMFDRRTPRDLAQLLVLSACVVVGTMLTGGYLAVAMLLLTYLPLLVWATVLRQLDWRTHASAAPGAEPVVHVGERAPSQLRGMVAASCAGTLLISVVLFVVLPRGNFINAGRGWAFQAHAMATGFRDDVRLGQQGLLSEDSTPVLDVTLRDGRGRDIGGQLRTLYLRAAVLDRYDPTSGTWRASRAEERRAETRQLQADSAWDLVKPARVTGVVQTEITLRGPRPGNGYLFTLFRPIRVALGQAGTVSYRAADGVLRVNVPQRGERLSYTVFSMLDSGSEGTVAETLFESGPFATGPIRALAERLIRDADVPADTAVREASQIRRGIDAIMAHLRNGFSYTTEMVAPPPGQDPIEMFVFETRRGHCEYFASAMAALCRAAGIPARVVTGYAATEFNAVTGAYVVRQSHAHAWVEASLGEGRWEVFDPTPPSELARRSRTTGLLAQLRSIYDAVDSQWVTGVLGFSEQTRLALFDSFARRARATFNPEGWKERLGRVVEAAESRAVLTWTAVALIVAAVSAPVAATLIRLRRRWSRLKSAVRTGHETWMAGLAARARSRARFYDRLLVLLARAGEPKPPEAHALAHALAVRAHDPELGDPAVRLVGRYYALRFAGADDDFSNDAIEADLARLERMVRARGRGARTQRR
ncbi:MAG: DUF3488 domain-containing protein [Phycisphaerae bacterium]|nr:DUF3488 domain-containing protein [Phycisphaerae bacterium]